MANHLDWFRVPEKIYFKKGSLPVALRELKDVYSRKKAFVLTDDSGFRNGLAKPVTDLLNEMGIFYSEIAVNENSVSQSVAVLNKFEPDCIIAVGNTAINAAKIILAQYENPELTPEELAKHTNTRDREIPVLKRGKAYFVAVAASDCAGTEVSPFSWHVEDYGFLPDMAIIDTDMIQKEDTALIKKLCDYALQLSEKILTSSDASDYAQGLAVQAKSLIGAYLPKYEKKPDDMFVLERLSNAFIMISMAYSNSCTPGVVFLSGNE